MASELTSPHPGQPQAVFEVSEGQLDALAGSETLRTEVGPFEEGI